LTFSRFISKHHFCFFIQRLSLTLNKKSKKVEKQGSATQSSRNFYNLVRYLFCNLILNLNFLQQKAILDHAGNRMLTI
jgi:hypothetical protein